MIIHIPDIHGNAYAIDDSKPLAHFINADCMAAMEQFPDDYFDLAIVDPPYGSGGKVDCNSNNLQQGGYWIGSDASAPGFGGGRFKRYQIQAAPITATRTAGSRAAKYQTEANNIRHWDVVPQPEYFAELARVAKNQIIWGGNYFDLPPTRCFVVWRKLTISESFSMAMCEYAWASYNDNAKYFECAPQGTAIAPRIHPTQKPIKLYQFLLSAFAKPGDRILDTHVGSASSLIAFHRAGYGYVGTEIDPSYYKAASERLSRETAQLTLFGSVRKDDE